VKTASAQHVTKKQTRAIAVSSINLSLFLSACTAATPSLLDSGWGSRWFGEEEMDGGQGETDGLLHSPCSFVNNVWLERASGQGGK